MGISLKALVQMPGEPGEVLGRCAKERVSLAKACRCHQGVVTRVQA